MECKISSNGAMNGFCATLRESDRAILCANCVRRDIVRGATLFKQESTQSIYVLVEGLLVADTPFDQASYFEGSRPGMGIMARGSVFSCDLLCASEGPDTYPYYLEHKDTNAVAYSNSVLGRWPLPAVKKLFGTSIDFANKLFCKNIEMFGLTCEFASALRPGNAEDSIKYLLCFGKTYGIELTHQQIADLTQRNRATVSRIMADLPRKDPEFIRQLETIARKG